MRLIDSDVLKELIANHVYPVSDVFNSRDYGMFWTGGIEKAIDDTPTVDAVEVVRCKDCKHYYADPWGYGNCVFEGGVSRRTKDSDYCSWGERREDR